MELENIIKPANVGAFVQKNYIVILLVVAYFVIAASFLKNYLVLDLASIATLLLSPYMFVANKAHRGKIIYPLFVLMFVALTWFTGVLTFYFMAIGFSILFAIESFIGRLNNIPLFLLGVLSPAFRYFNNMLGFQVRLELSNLAGKVLHMAGYKTEVLGNVIIMNGNEFSVDPACVGLKMMGISLLIGLLFMAYFQRATGKRLSFFKCSLGLLLVVLYNVVGNFLRILILVVFNIPPANPFHDFVGMACLLVYVIVPAYFTIKIIYCKARVVQIKAKAEDVHRRKILILNGLILLLVFATGFSLARIQPIKQPKFLQIEAKGYSKKIVDNEIIKLEKPGCLIYVKPLSRFYGAEHNPMICWVGSGYEFSRINKQTIAGKEVYTGILKKGTEIIYSAWWFDNGTCKTISQTEWRWRALKGEQFYLVNVNSENQIRLNDEVKVLLNNALINNK
jgi:exosortase N